MSQVVVAVTASVCHRTSTSFSGVWNLLTVSQELKTNRQNIKKSLLPAWIQFEVWSHFSCCGWQSSFLFLSSFACTRNTTSGDGGGGGGHRKHQASTGSESRTDIHHSRPAGSRLDGIHLSSMFDLVLISRLPLHQRRFLWLFNVSQLCEYYFEYQRFNWHEKKCCVPFWPDLSLSQKWHQQQPENFK